MTVSNGVVGCSMVQTTVPLGIGTLISNGEVLSQNCYTDSEDAYIAFSGAPPSASTAWLSQVRITPSSAASFISQQVEVETTTALGCGVQSCAACPDGEVQSLCDAVQACTVINCIGTPINMRRVLCQLGETFADEARESLSVLYGGWVVFVDMFMVLMELSLRKGLLGITVSFPDDAFFGYVCTAKDQSAHLISIFTSAINDAVQIAHSVVLYLQGGAQEIDSNFNAQVTMPLTALTSFLYHMTLWPLYGLIASQKVMMCRVEGLVAVFDVAGFGVSIGDAGMEAASDAAVGHCLTQNFATQMADPAANTHITARIVSQVA